MSGLIDGTWTEPKSYCVEFGRTAIPTSNGHFSETKQNFLDTLVPKFSYDRGLSPTLSWQWPSATFSPSFGLFQSEKKHFFRVFRVSPGGALWSDFAPGTAFQVGKKSLIGAPYFCMPCEFCDLFRWGIFTHFHSACLKTHYILSGGGQGGSGEVIWAMHDRKHSFFKEVFP